MFDELLKTIEKPEDLIGAQHSESLRGVSRRDLMKYGFLGILGSVTPFLPGDQAKAAGSQWRLDLHQAHTGEAFQGVYRVGDEYLPEAFERLNYMLRDFRTGEIFPMDPRILDLVSLMQSKVPGKTFEILSAYRSPKTNAMLSRVGTGVARNSYHMYGQAMDVRAWGYSSKRLRGLARSFRVGGVGYYPKSNFVHIDTGDLRSW